MKTVGLIIKRNVKASNEPKNNKKENIGAKKGKNKPNKELKPDGE